MLASADTPPPTGGPRLAEARFPEDAETLRRLFLAYQDWLQIDLCFQGFEQELAGLPGAYARPAGNAWLAYLDAERDGDAVGCVAVRPLALPGTGETGFCEMKRLYVEERARGLGLGARLAERAVAWAAGAGYRRMRLDTLQSMTAARGIYARLGFTEIPPYNDSPLEGTLYLELDLADWRRRNREPNQETP